MIIVGANSAAGELEQAATKNADTSKTNFIVSMCFKCTDCKL